MNHPLPSYEDTLAGFASKPSESKGRMHEEPESVSRSCFQRDRDRIIHSSAFRRLEYKTQVFVNHEGDHFRTRLTHSLEVAQLARSLSRSLHINEDLAESLALAHDLGHTPFGHAGEDALKAAMQEYGGFDHNAQAIRILTELENRYAEFEGLNLTFETLEGIAKHNGPLDSDSLPWALEAYNSRHDLHLHTWPGLEAQIAALADDIAYHNHDIDDGVRAGLFTLDDLCHIPRIANLLKEIDTGYAGIHPRKRVHELIRHLIGDMVTDLLARTRHHIQAHKIHSVEDVRRLGKATAEFSPEVADIHSQLKSFLMERMYRHFKVNRMTSKARRVISDLFVFFHSEPECLPTRWRESVATADAQWKARIVADFIAGMTDRFALQEHKRLFTMEPNI
jgi:dGTPase